MYKQCLILRSDLRLSRGKLAAQAAHASILSYEKSSPSERKKWLEEGGKKIVLSVPSLEDLLKLRDRVESLNLPFSLVEDAGMTEVKPGTITALGIGPSQSDKIDKVTANLKLLR